MCFCAHAWVCGVGSIAHAEKKEAHHVRWVCGYWRLLFLPPGVVGFVSTGWLSAGWVRQGSSLMPRVSPAAVAKVLPSCMLCDPAALCCMQQYAAPAWWCGWVGAWHQSHPASLLLQACGMGLPANSCFGGETKCGGAVGSAIYAWVV